MVFCAQSSALPPAKHFDFYLRALAVATLGIERCVGGLVGECLLVGSATCAAEDAKSSVLGGATRVNGVL
jgi:hypothetical protein